MTFRFILITVALLMWTACTSQKESEKPEDYAEFIKETDLMISMAEKLSTETDAAKLQKVASSASLLKMFNCRGYDEACRSYNRFLTSAIDVAKDGSITVPERNLLREKVGELRTTISKFK